MPRSRSRSRSPRRERRRSRSRERTRHRHRGGRSRSPPGRYRSRSRSPGGRRRSRSPGGRRSRSNSPRRRSRSRDRESGKSQDKRHQTNERPVIDEAQLEGMTQEEIEMMKTMGFANFDTTKGKKVHGNDVYVTNLTRKRRYRQYMNRRGGFNRPLDFIA